jgi:tryptophanyl-tRNA synthetase
MSASKGEKHNIDVFSDPEKIKKQFRSAVTDAGEADPAQMSPGVANLFLILKATGEHTACENLAAAYAAGQLRYVDLKDTVADAVVWMTTPFRERLQEIHADKRAFKDRIRASSEVIRKKAQTTLREVKEMVGLLNP